MIRVPELVTALDQHPISQEYLEKLLRIFDRSEFGIQSGASREVADESERTAALLVPLFYYIEELQREFKRRIKFHQAVAALKQKYADSPDVQTADVIVKLYEVTLRDVDDAFRALYRLKNSNRPHIPEVPM